MPKFKGKPDSMPFDCDDIYEVLPMLGAVMDALEMVDERALHLVEELMIRDLPTFIRRRDDVYDFLVNCAQELLEQRPVSLAGKKNTL
jgi:hypothetical protein